MYCQKMCHLCSTQQHTHKQIHTHKHPVERCVILTRNVLPKDAPSLQYTTKTDTHTQAPCRKMCHLDKKCTAKRCAIFAVHSTQHKQIHTHKHPVERCVILTRNVRPKYVPSLQYIVHNNTNRYTHTSVSKGLKLPG